MKIGFFGGCFNPPTNAHINLAKKAIDECKLDKLIFMPVGDFYEKRELASSKDRYKMLKIACNGIENVEVSDLEINANKKLYAVDAFKMIEKEYKNEDIFFIMGADNFSNITKWKESDDLLEKYQYIVLERKNIDINKQINENFKFNKIKNKIYILDNKIYEDVSSTNVRNMLRSENASNQISTDVLEYITKNNIYRGAKWEKN